MTPARLIVRLAFVLAAGSSACGCVEEGFSPDCPQTEDYLDDDGEVDFDAWRRAAEEAGCLTPIGGTSEGGGGNDS